MAAPPTSSPPLPDGPDNADDVALALALTTRWVLLTGRRLDCETPLFHELPVSDLIDFWADDQLLPCESAEASGRAPDDLANSVQQRSASAWPTCRVWSEAGTARALRHARHRHRRLRHAT